ncbi:MAG: hypothetical protein U0872_08835 [Planctomycetaceae bacterium]
MIRDLIQKLVDFMGELIELVVNPANGKPFFEVTGPQTLGGGDDAVLQRINRPCRQK